MTLCAPANGEYVPRGAAPHALSLVPPMLGLNLPAAVRGESRNKLSARCTTASCANGPHVRICVSVTAGGRSIARAPRIAVVSSKTSARAIAARLTWSATPPAGLALLRFRCAEGAREAQRANLALLGGHQIGGIRERAGCASNGARRAPRTLPNNNDCDEGAIATNVRVRL